MFATLSMVIPIVNLIWGDDLFAIGCKTITVPLNDLNNLLDARNKKFNTVDEHFHITDSDTNTSSVSIF